MTDATQEPLQHRSRWYTRTTHRLGTSQVDDLWTTIAILLLLSALPTVVSVRDARPTADRAPPLIFA